MRHFLALLLVLLAGLSSSLLRGDDGSGLKFGANADIVGRFGIIPDTSAGQKLEVREAELMVYAPVDHLFDGRISLAAHQEAGEAVFEIHEAYFGSSKLIPRSRFRVGQFFLGVGRLNQFHRHDWPFVSAPRVHRTFFAEEAAIDAGLEYSWLTPLPFYLDVTVGVTNGFVFGHAHNAGTKPAVPTHYLRLETFFGQSTGGIQVGLNYLSRKTMDRNRTTLLGLDNTVKWKDEDNWPYLIQAEVWYRIQKPDGADASRQLGLYIFPSIPIFSPNLSLGVRFDLFTTYGVKDVLGNSVSSYEYGAVPTLTYKSSEFATFRLSFNMMQNRLGGSLASREQAFETQAVVILGAHPAHDF